MKKILFLLLLISSSLTAQVKEITFNVQVPKESDTVYITGNQSSLGDWDPGAVMLEKTSAKKRSITLPLTFPAEFKFTRGSWDSEGYVGDKYDIQNIIISKPVKNVKYRIHGWYDEGNFSFDQEYIRANKGKYSIEVPEVQELVHIIMALTVKGMEDRNLINQEGNYYQQVIQKFGSYKDDPVVLNMNSLRFLF